MKEFSEVYRFLKEDEESARDFLFSDKNKHSENPEIKNERQKTAANREDFAESSPLEFYFEEEFSKVYGESSLSFLNKEYSITNENGDTFFLDYLVHTDDGDIAVEENGINYHHPQIIGTEKYRKQLAKQNECTKWGIKLYRFSTEDCKFEEKIQDDIKRFFGSDTRKFNQSGIIASRAIKLYEHQKLTLEDIQKSRKNGVSTFLVVLPTAAGKSKIIEEDLKHFSKQTKDFKALILAPNKDIIEDWKKRISSFKAFTATSFSIFKEEYPLPKSSIKTANPASNNCLTVRFTFSLFSA